jgi:Domain of unknown function (DUF4037)
MPDFVQGLNLCGQFFSEVVSPILATHYPQVVYSAALIGYGSEVLGYDTVESTDHFWAPRVNLFLSATDFPDLAEPIHDTLRHKLPYTFRGYSTNMVYPIDGDSKGPVEIESGPVNHLISISSTRGWFAERLGIEVDKPLSVIEWLTIPEQRLLEVTAGQVYYDGLSELIPIRQKLAYYPHDIWLYKMAGVWRRVEQEEAFVGRTGSVGDEIGSQLIATRLVHDLMTLCYLIEKHYAPYPKWFGTAFSRLKCSLALLPILESVLHAEGWQAREQRLAAAYEIVATMHNNLGITKALPAQVSRFHGRPYLVIHGDVFSAAITEQITDEAVKSLPLALGGVDEFVHSTDVLAYPDRYRKLKALYETNPSTKR